MYGFARNMRVSQCSRAKALKNSGCTGIVALFLALPALSHAATPTVSCESLAKLELLEVTIALVQSVAVGKFQDPRQSVAESSGPGGPGGPPAGGPPRGARGPFGVTDMGQLPAFCRVAATLKPSGDSDIKMEIWMPLTNWNGKFMGAGNFGWGGALMYDGLRPPSPAAAACTLAAPITQQLLDCFAQDPKLPRHRILSLPFDHHQPQCTSRYLYP
jgi:hypothetical protein